MTLFVFLGFSYMDESTMNQNCFFHCKRASSLFMATIQINVFGKSFVKVIVSKNAEHIHNNPIKQVVASPQSISTIDRKYNHKN